MPPTKERLETLFKVAQRGVEIALAGGTVFGDCAIRAAEELEVELTEDERMRMVLTIAKATMLVRAQERKLNEV